MSGFLNKALHCGCSFRLPGDPRKVDRDYVSEFTGFMDRYLGRHPEAIAEQKAGRSIYWEKRVDLAEQARAEQDSVPADGYGFYASAWCHDKR